MIPGIRFVIRQTSKPHWYKITTEECPVCGRYITIRERVYGEKPTDYRKIYQWVPVYDWCNL